MEVSIRVICSTNSREHGDSSTSPQLVPHTHNPTDSLSDSYRRSKFKNIVGKTMKNKGDVYLSLLSFRSTPVDHDLPSPAELLFNRKIRSTLPTRTPNKNPQRDHIAERLQHRQTTQNNYFDNKSTSRTPLIPEQHIYVQQQTGKKRWEPAQVQALRDEPRSYEILTSSGQTLRRNRRHLKESSTEVNVDPDPEVQLFPPSDTPVEIRQPNTQPTPIQTRSDTHYHYKQTHQPQITRTGRHTKARKQRDL